MGKYIRQIVAIVSLIAAMHMIANPGFMGEPAGTAGCLVGLAVCMMMWKEIMGEK